MASASRNENDARRSNGGVASVMALAKSGISAAKRNHRAGANMAAYGGIMAKAAAQCSMAAKLD